MRGLADVCAHILMSLALTAQIARGGKEVRQSDVQGRVQGRELPRQIRRKIGKALTLQYKTVDLACLPLYIALSRLHPRAVVHGRAPI